MRRAVISVLGICVLLSLGCGRNEPKGPYVPLVSRLDAESDFIFLLDLSSLSKGLENFRKTTKNIPLVAKHPELKSMLDQQWAIMDSSLAMAKGMLGVDPLKDFNRMAIGIRLEQNAKDPSMVLVIDGKIPADTIKKLFPGVNPEKKFGVDIWNIPQSGFHVAVLGGKTLVASTGEITDNMIHGTKVSKSIIQHHPDIFGDGSDNFYVRASFFVHPWVVNAIEQGIKEEKDLGVLNSLLSLRRIFADFSDLVRVSVLCSDPGGAEHFKSILEAEAEMMMGGQNLVRGITYMVMAMDLELLDDLPPAFMDAFSDRKAQEQTLETLFPEPVREPVVRQNGNKVSLEADLGLMKGSFTTIGILASLAVPAFLQFQQKVDDSRQMDMQNNNQMQPDYEPVNPDGTLRKATDKGPQKAKGAKQ